MTDRASKPDGDGPEYSPDDEPADNPALTGELPTRAGRRIAGQVFFLGVAVGLIVLFTTDRDEPEPEPEPEPAVTVDGPTINHRGHQYQLGRTGDLVVIRECDGVALPWLLRPSTGELYRFNGWASDQFVDAVLVRSIEGATSLRVVGGAICDHIHVEVADGSDVVISG